MKKSKIALYALSFATAATLGVGATLAYFTDSTSVENVITMGHVDISLDEPAFVEKNGGSEIKNVVPNQEIEKDPTITVESGSEDCYVRAGVEISGLDATQQAALLSKMNICSDDWYSGTDGYYYYKEKLTEGDSVQLFTKVTVPETWGNEVVDSSFRIHVSAEAIQADNFTPVVDENGMITAWNYSNGDAITAETYTAPQKTGVSGAE